MNAREVAWRVFAGELNDSSLVVTSDEERSPTYVITPLGAKVNRVYMVGVVTDLENVGSPEEPMWRARMIDPTGTTYISAGQFQPEAALAMSKLTVPGFAAVIGKVRVYSPEEGVMYISIRPETVKPVERSVRDAWVLDGCISLKQRLEAVAEAKKMDAPSAEALVSLGYAKNLADGIVAAGEHYGDIPVEKYQSMLIDSLRYLIPEEGGAADIPEPVESIEPEEPDDYDEFEEGVDMPPAPPVMERDEPAPEKPGSADDPDEELTDDEERLLKVINEEDPKTAGMDWDALAKAAGKAGLKKEAFEEAVEGLLDKGLIYEPMLGKIRKI